MRILNDTAKKLLEAIDETPNITIQEMCDKFYLSRSAVTKYLKKFREKGLIISNGEKKEKYARLLTNKARLLLTKS